ncbi:MAG: Do family serine endopeptidase [Sphingobacteriaceae bacterium]|jgi:Do/DeqQ family serine protease|nr:Do family serine endopeptidase [Sphingobacteriaceae bacterium]
MKKIAVTLLTACIGGAVAVGGYKLIEDKYAGNMSLEDKQKVYFTKNPLEVNASTGNIDFTQAAAAVTPGVVHIKTTYKNSSQNRGGGSMEDMFNDFFGGGGGRMQQMPVMASGSGVIISQDGYIVTNNHVVEDATEINVLLPDRRSFDAKVIGRDPNTDLALIKISANNLPIVKMGNSDNVQVGEWVLAVGYPFTLNTTVTAGIVSAKGRSIGILGQSEGPGRRYGQQGGEPQPNTAIESFIQTDAAINRGNSGGALVNASGELIGINAAIASQSGNYEGYGFAIPINLAKKVLEDFKQFGAVKRGFIGVNFTELDAERASQLGTKQITGLYVSDVVPGSGAEAAGLRKGDIIVKADDNPVYSSADLQERVGRLRPGDKVKVGYLRDGKEYSSNITLKGEDSVKIASNNNSNSGAGVSVSKLGASFSTLSPAQKQRYRVNSGVVVSGVRQGGLFDSYGIPKGLIITNINGKAIAKPDDVGAALSSSKDGLIRISGIGPDGAQIMSTFPAE